jgi:phosphoglycerate dehydrogenase-like enzyme
MKMLRGLFILDVDALAMVYGLEERAEIARHVDFVAPPQTAVSVRKSPELLHDVDVIFSGWGMPRADHSFLKTAPKLKAIFYGAGSVSSWMTEAVWDRGITVTSAYAANAIPVAEYALGTILFSLKHGWSLARQTQQRRVFPNRNGAPGCFGTTVGLISLGITARKLVDFLRPFDLKVCAYDPYVSPTDAARIGVELVSLDELFRKSDVVSLHAPLLPETIGMIGGSLLAKMKPGATFINTSRGTIVRQDELIEVAERRQDLQFVLDVSEPEPPLAESLLYTLQNVVLTPHIAGSVGCECERMGRTMAEELKRYITGQPLEWEVTPELAAISSHRPSDSKISVKVAEHVISKRKNLARAT